MNVRSEPSVRYVALLRGMNMIGRKLVAMEELARLFSQMRFQRVKTVLATGNVLFDAPASDPAVLTSRIEESLRASLGYDVTAHLRTIAGLADLVRLDPFSKEAVDNRRSKAFVTFLSRPPEPIAKLPMLSPKKDFKIVALGPR
jgi:uncharacterized protein (DUF1697 family)